MLERALSAGDYQANVQAQIINGAPLRYNWENSATAQGQDARQVLPEGKTTHLILTEAIPLENHVSWSETSAYAAEFASLAESANPDVHIYVQETWHSLKSGTGQTVEYDKKADVPWRQRLEDDLPVWEGIVAAIEAKLVSETAQVSLIPAGQAMALLYDEIQDGNVQGVSSIDTFFDDDIHLNDQGHYFVAMVQYATLTGRSPVGLPAAFKNRFGASYSTPIEARAKDLQEIAWAATQAYTEASAVSIETQEPKAANGHEVVAADALQVRDFPDAVPARGAPEGTNRVAIGLASVADWSSQSPFLDVMKSARPWIGHLPGQWGGMDFDAVKEAAGLDKDGWPQRIPPSLGSIGTLVLTDLPEDAISLAGRYVLRFDGNGIVEVSGRAENVRYGQGEVQFDYTPGRGSVEIRLQRTSPSEPVRNVTVVHQDFLADYEAGATFNPRWIERLSPFSAVRFMDWMEINNSDLQSWEDRPLPGDAFYAPGVPIEVMIELANRLQADPWFNVPHLADDNFVRHFAEMVWDDLDPNLTAYVEFSNEVWNWQFAQAQWADQQARARWGQDNKWMQFYGLRAAEVAEIWSDVFADAGDHRLVNVISTQTGWLGLEREVLDAPLVAGEGRNRPVSAFDAYAVSGYFGGVLGLEDRAQMIDGWLSTSQRKAVEDARQAELTGEQAVTYVMTHRYGQASRFAGQELMDGRVSGNTQDTVADLVNRVWPYHAEVAAQEGLDLIMYEGGSHVVGLGTRVDNERLTSFLQHLNYTEEMGLLYATLLNAWRDLGGQLFNAYSDVYVPTKWGSWGGLRHLDDENPRWDALVAFQ